MRCLVWETVSERVEGAWFSMKADDKRDVDLTPEEMARFARHLSLPEVGMAGQKRLKAAAVLCVGSGGLGSPLLLYLAAAGVGRIGIVDFDLVDVSNLQRQVIHGTSWVGQPKTSSARSRILEINPYCQVDVFETALTSDNALEIIRPYDLVCDGTDNFPSRYLVNDACVILGKPNVYGSIHRFEGQASVFNLNSDSPNYRDLVPEPPPPGLVPSCAEGGVMGVLPGLIGLIQATEAIKIITGIGSPLDGRLLLVDALSMSFKELRLRQSQERVEIDHLIDYQDFCGMNRVANDPPLESISVQDLKKLIEEKAGELLLLDVRNPYEYEIGSIAGAELIPLSDIENKEAIDRIRELMIGRRLFVYCKAGARSQKALLELKRHGIEGVNVVGGMDAWVAEVE